MNEIKNDLPELTQLIREATKEVEDALTLEDKGWINLSAGTEVIPEASRLEYVKQSRLYSIRDPLAKQSIRLWTDYTFGTGMTWACEDEPASNVLSAYWYSRANKSVLSPRGQRRCSDKLLIDGEVFFAMFLGNDIKVRLIDPLEITELITDPDDRDNVRYYKRVWTDTQGVSHTDYYCSHLNPKNEPCKDSRGTSVTQTPNAKNVLVYHLAYNTTGQRGYPLLLPALDWITQYRRFLASRVAIMLALARFAWKTKVTGGAAAVASAKAVLNDKVVPAGSVAVENMASELTPIRTDSNARNAYDDGRMLKLQVAAAVGIPEQYYGDISIGNLATAKTVELPMMKQFESYQAIWGGAYADMDELILEHNNLPTDTNVDRDFPAIAPEDAAALAIAFGQILTAIPEFADIRDVKQVALMSLGINNTADVLDALDGQTESMNAAKISKALKNLKEVMIQYNKGNVK